MGLCMGLQPAMSYRYGAGDEKGFCSIIKNTAVLSVVFSSVLCLLIYLFRSSLVKGFLDNPKAIGYSTSFLILPLPAGSFHGLYQLSQSCLQFSGKASYATFTAILGKGLYPEIFLLLIWHCLCFFRGHSVSGPDRMGSVLEYFQTAPVRKYPSRAHVPGSESGLIFWLFPSFEEELF